MGRPSFQELEPKILEFDCKDFDGKVFFVWCNEDIEYKHYNDEFDEFLSRNLDFEKKAILYRGTSIDNLKNVLSHGSSNENLNEGFWGSLGLEKAMEYGHLILCYDFRKCSKSCRTFELDSLGEEALEELREKYHSEMISIDGKEIFFSMFPTERRGRVHYERDYGYYIPGDEKEALQGIIILGGGPEQEQLLETIANVAKCGGSLQLKGQEVFSRE